MAARTTPLALALAHVVAAASCFVIDFDPDADGVFACSGDAECGDAQLCVLGVCRDDDGPRLRVASPEDYARVPVGESEPLTLVIEGEGVTLAPPGSATEGSAYLELELDGEPRVTPIGEGSLDAGVPVSVDTSALAPGFHRVRVRALQLDGQPYENPSAVAYTTFWIDDGDVHVAIRRPWPGAPQLVGQPIEVEIAALHFSFADPTRADLKDTPTEHDRGHTHVYLGKEYPSCLPGCNGEYAPDGMLAPVGMSEGSTITAVIGGAPEEPQTLSLSASLNYSNHSPVGAPVLDQVNEAITSGALVYDAISVEFVR